MKNLGEQIKVILNITKYSIMMFFREKTAIYFSLFIPLLIMGIFGLLNMDRMASVKLGLADEAHNQISQQVVDSLKKIDTLKISEGTKDEELDSIKKGNLDLVLVLPADFGSNIAKYQMQKAALAQAPTRGAQAQAQAPVQPTLDTQNLELYQNQNTANSGVQIGMTILDKVFDQFTHQVSGTPNLFALETKSVDAVKHTYIDFIVPGVAAMSVMQLSIFGVVGAIVSWRERGILKRLLATPIRPSNIIFGQVVTRLIITLLQVSVLISMGLIFFHLNIVGSLPLVFFVAFLGGIAFLSMGFALSGVADTQNSVMAIGNLIMMPQMFLSGVFFPREALPEVVQKITNYFPFTYLSDAMRQVMNNGATMYQVRGDLLGLTVWGIIIFFIASKTFRWE
jgi:ABC-2 type transport system permease protein